MDDQAIFMNEGWLGFNQVKSEYQKWAPIFYQLGLKPRRYFKTNNAVYICTEAGWFRLGFIKYGKEELQWVNRVLQHLEEGRFANWGVPWSKSLIWEEQGFSYLIQPWCFSKDSFDPRDPAAIIRLTEILSDLYYCSQNFVDNNGPGILRNRWRSLEEQWQADLQLVEMLDEKKLGLTGFNFKKQAVNTIEDTLKIWDSVIKGWVEADREFGSIGHGKLLSKYIVAQPDDYYLLNWEHLSFQPKVTDLVSVINDVGIWEEEWVAFIINEYTKLQPFWPEEYRILVGMLQYPVDLLKFLHKLNNEPNLKINQSQIKKFSVELSKKADCLLGVWQQLGIDDRWGGYSGIAPESNDEAQEELSMAEPSYENGENYVGAELDVVLPFDETMEQSVEKWEDDVVNEQVDDSLNSQIEPTESIKSVQLEEVTEAPTVAELEEIRDEQVWEALEPQVTSQGQGDQESAVEKPNFAVVDQPMEVAESRVKLASWGKFPKPLSK